MGTVKLQGIVIGERIQGESNKQIVVLAKGVGRVLLSARGARKAKSKLLAAAQLFCYADFVAYEGRGFYSVTQAELLNSFYALRTDMEKLAEAVYLAELTDRTCPEGTEQDEILALPANLRLFRTAGLRCLRLGGRQAVLRLAGGRVPMRKTPHARQYPSAWRCTPRSSLCSGA